MKKLVLMKYLNDKNMPCYHYIREDDMSGTDEYRLEMMDLKKEELLSTGEMSKHLWTKLLTEEQYKSLLDAGARYRMKMLDHMLESLG